MYGFGLVVLDCLDTTSTTYVTLFGVNNKMIILLGLSSIIAEPLLLVHIAFFVLFIWSWNELVPAPRLHAAV